MAIGPETRLRKKIVKALQEKYPEAWIKKIHGNKFQNIGMPDLVCCFEGKFVAIEIKNPGKERTTTPAQLLEIMKIRKSKGVAGVVTTIEEALELLGAIQ